MSQLKSTGKGAGWGLIAFAVLWLTTVVRLDHSAIAESNIQDSWQSLGVDALSNNLFSSLGVLHTQPPGLNLIYAFDLAVTPTSHIALTILYFLFAGISIYIVTDVLLRFGLPRKWAGAAALLYALLPATVIYSLWPFTTTACAFFGATAIWGISYLRTNQLLGVVLTSFSTFALVMTRASFTVPFLIAWLAVVAMFVLRNSKQTRKAISLAIIGVFAVSGIAIQFHYTSEFGIPTMSSWSGENLAKALTYSGARTVTPAAVERLKKDPCALQMLDAWQNGKLRTWDVKQFDALSECAKLSTPAIKGVASWDDPVKVNSNQDNFNYARRLVLSKEWSTIAIAVVRERPSQLFKMALSSGSGPRDSSLGVFLSPAEDYPGVTAIRDKNLVAQPLGFLSLLFAPAMVFLLLVAIAMATFGKAYYLRRNPVFWFAIGFLSYQILVSVLFEYGENMRFQAEIAPLLVIVGFIGLWAPLSRQVSELDPSDVMSKA